MVSIAGIEAEQAWQRITPDQHGDWLRQRVQGLSAYLPMGDKNGASAALFANYSQAETGRDPWCYNASKSELLVNMGKMLATYNSEVQRLSKVGCELDRKARAVMLDAMVDNDPESISWTSSLKQSLMRQRSLSLDETAPRPSLYRPFPTNRYYYSGELIHRVGQMPHIFPNSDSKNRMIVVKQRWSGDGQLALS